MKSVQKHKEILKPSAETHGLTRASLLEIIKKFMKKHKVQKLSHTSILPGGGAGIHYGDSDHEHDKRKEKKEPIDEGFKEIFDKTKRNLKTGILLGTVAVSLLGSPQKAYSQDKLKDFVKKEFVKNKSSETTPEKESKADIISRMEKMASQDKKKGFGIGYSDFEIETAEKDALMSANQDVLKKSGETTATFKGTKIVEEHVFKNSEGRYVCVVLVQVGEIN